MKLEFESNVSTASHFENDYAVADVGLEKKAAMTIPQILQAGIKAAQAGNRNEARQMLVQVTEAEPDNETAWLWMASISEYPEELIIFLNNVLSINPRNTRAIEWMSATKTLLANTFIQRGVDATTDANLDFARQCFLQAIAHEPESETAWFQLAMISEAADEKISHLQKVLNINSTNETARDLIETAKKQVAETTLRKANSAAIAGERESARVMLREVLEYEPEMESAWILGAYLAESFSEKITCYEKVLSLNPENEMAQSGLNSLRAMMAKTEAKKADQKARLAELENIVMAEEVLQVEEAQIVFEGDNEDVLPTQELEFPPDFNPDNFNQAEEQNVNEASDIRHLLTDTSYHEATPAFNQATENIDHLQHTEEQPDLSSETEFKGENYMNYNESNNQSVESNQVRQNEFARSFENTPENQFANTFSGSRKEFSMATEMKDCPFCTAENEPNAVICSSCRTILTLSDLEMLLAHTEADRETLKLAVDKMEFERNTRQLSVEELKNLAIGQINLKNLRIGVSYLQKAAQMNPNDVVLGSKVNVLKIRLSEIEQQETLNSQMTKGKKIMVIDDSATVRKLISSKLEKSGHEVMSAVDGIDALEKIKEFIPDLILLDIMMPQLDGYQVCKLIRTNEMTKDVPIVMISGKDGFFDKVRGRMAGTTGYITKPFGPETLMKAVETYISQRGVIMTDEAETEE